MPRQAPLSMEILQARILEWLPYPPPGDVPNPGIEPRSPTWQADSLPSELLGKPSVSPNSELFGKNLNPSVCWSLLPQFAYSTDDESTLMLQSTLADSGTFFTILYKDAK